MDAPPNLFQSNIQTGNDRDQTSFIVFIKGLLLITVYRFFTLQNPTKRHETKNIFNILEY